MKEKRKVNQEPEEIQDQWEWLKHTSERITKQNKFKDQESKSTVTRLSTLKQAQRTRTKNSVETEHLFTRNGTYFTEI